MLDIVKQLEKEMGEVAKWKHWKDVCRFLRCQEYMYNCKNVEAPCDVALSKPCQAKVFGIQVARQRLGYQVGCVVKCYCGHHEVPHENPAEHIHYRLGETPLALPVGR